MLVEMAVKSMEMAVEATASMEMAPGVLPRPGRVPEQRLLSLEIRRWRRRSCGTSSGKLPIDLGFSVESLYIGGETASEGDQGAHTIGWRAPGVTRTALGCGRPLAPLRLSFSLRLASGKNRRFGLCFFQFQEYFLCSFSKSQNSRKHGTDTLASRQ
jgi:hypothetical protein